ncbi:YncE family protein [Emticicia fontis]
MNFKKLALISFVSIVLFSCETKETEPAQPYDTGVFIINAGNFFDNNGSISLLKRDSTKAILDIFQKENSRTITGNITDYAVVDNKGIILVDNSTDGQDAIEIVNGRTFKSEARIKEVENPRNAIKVAANKAYVVCWDVLNADYSYKPGYVLVIDLLTNKVTKKITVQNGAEGIVVVGNEAFVGNNAYSGKSEISVIDINKDEVSTKITLKGGTTNLIVDANNKIWCSVDKEFLRINPSTKAVEATISTETSTEKVPGMLALNANKTTIYFDYSHWSTGGEIYSFNITDATISTTTPLIKRTFSALGFDAKEGIIYAGVTPSYKQSGYVFRYKPTGVLIDSVKAEIAPAKFLFK